MLKYKARAYFVCIRFCFSEITYVYFARKIRVYVWVYVYMYFIKLFASKV